MNIPYPQFVTVVAGALVFVGCRTPASVFQSDVLDALARVNAATPAQIVTERDIEHMPAPMQRYLRYAGVLGRPLAKTARIRQEGLFKTSEKSDWKNIVAEEYYFPFERTFFWYGEVRFAPRLTAYALDKYSRGKGSMWVKLANVFTVVNGSGEKFDSSSLIRYFNELVWFPSGFIDSAISFRAIDDTKTEITITDNGIATSAILHFNSIGEIILFESNDRYAMTDNGLEKAPWRTPMRNYKEFDGYKVPTEGEAIYRLKSGDFEYARLKIVDAEYSKKEMYGKK
jgi:hypothetical protein